MHHVPTHKRDTSVLGSSNILTPTSGEKPAVSGLPGMLQVLGLNLNLSRKAEQKVDLFPQSDKMMLFTTLPGIDVPQVNWRCAMKGFVMKCEKDLGIWTKGCYQGIRAA